MDLSLGPGDELLADGDGFGELLLQAQNLAHLLVRLLLDALHPLLHLLVLLLQGSVLDLIGLSFYDPDTGAFLQFQHPPLQAVSPLLLLLVLGQQVLVLAEGLLELVPQVLLLEAAVGPLSVVQFLVVADLQFLVLGLHLHALLPELADLDLHALHVLDVAALLGLEPLDLLLQLHFVQDGDLHYAGSLGLQVRYLVLEVVDGYLQVLDLLVGLAGALGQSLQHVQLGSAVLVGVLEVLDLVAQLVVLRNVLPLADSQPLHLHLLLAQLGQQLLRCLAGLPQLLLQVLEVADEFVVVPQFQFLLGRHL